MLSFSTFLVILWIVLFVVRRTRKVAWALLPWLLFACLYDVMRLFPNYTFHSIDIRGIYTTEQDLFGVTTEEGRMILGAWCSGHHCAVGDLLAGLFYLCWVPVPMAYALWLFAKGRQWESATMALAFLWVNILGFIIYYLHPAAPPWYALNYGFDYIANTPSSTAGLQHFDSLVHVPLFAAIYQGNSNIFAAVPSLHSAYVLLAAIYAIINKERRGLVVAFFIITVGIWCAAVYTCHHYVIDVLAGIAVALAGVLLLQGVLLRIPPVRRAVAWYARQL